MLPKLGADIWRKWVTNGVPSSNLNKPDKDDIREWATSIEGLVFANTGSGGRIYATKAQMDADTAPAINTPCIVAADGSNTGLWRKTAATGSAGSTKILDFIPGAQFVSATDAGTGTESAINATSALPVSQTAGAQLIRLSMSTTNTGAMTVSFNGGSAIPIKTMSDTDPVAGSITSGMVLAGTIQNVASVLSFRLLTDLSSAGIQSAAQASATSAATSADTATKAALVTGYFPAAQSNVPRGIASATIGAAGSGGTNGTYTLSVSGGNFSVQPTGTVTVSGGAVTAVTITGAGLYVGASPTAPTVSLAGISGLTGATVTLNVGFRVASGSYYATDHASDATLLTLYFNNAGTAAISSPAIHIARGLGNAVNGVVATPTAGTAFPSGSFTVGKVGGEWRLYVNDAGTVKSIILNMES
jgi:hypothetical protein